jgi:hypothetical protein
MVTKYNALNAGVRKYSGSLTGIRQAAAVLEIITVRKMVIAAIHKGIRELKKLRFHLTLQNLRQN